MEQRRVVKLKSGTINKGNWFDCDKLRVVAQAKTSERLNNNKNVESWYLEFREGGTKYA